MIVLCGSESKIVWSSDEGFEQDLYGQNKKSSMEIYVTEEKNSGTTFWSRKGKNSLPKIKEG